MHQQQLFDGKYKILKTLGTGGTSSVFLAENVRLGTLWAIKEIQKQKNQAIHFLTEPHVLKNLRHPAMPRIFDIIENEEFLYLIQDYIEGMTLETIIIRDGPIPEQKLIDWAIDICDVYIYLHGQSPNPIIYRDMKPGNLIIDESGSIKLIDFGIAREFKTDSPNDTVCLGTRGYAAPEQYGTSQTDPRSDIYSLGVTLYHALTGNGPNDPPYDLMPLTEWEGVWSRAFGRVIDTAMKNDPGQRFQSASEMRKALINVKEPQEQNSVPRHEIQQHCTGPVVFGVGGVENRCGVTFHSVMLANYLARSRRESVALVEYNVNPCIGVMNPRKEQGPFREAGVVYFPGTLQNYTSGLKFGDFREFKYVVLDLGELKPFSDGVMVQGPSYLEMTRVHSPMLIASGAPWRLNSLMAFNYCQDNLDSWNILITPTAKDTFNQVAPAASRYFNKKRFYHSNPEPDPFRISKSQEELFEKIIREIIPVKAKGMFGILKK